MAYSATVGAALALAPLASAQITNITTTASDTASGNNNGTPINVTFSAGLASFNLVVQTSGNQFGFVGVKPQTHASAGVHGGSLAKLDAGSQIKGFNGFGRGSLQAFNGSGGGAKRGSFQPASSHDPAVGYMAFKEVANGHNYYGWLRISVTEGANNGNVAQGIALDAVDGITGAYNATPNGAITAGEVSAIPEPGSVASGLGLLALGAAGVREMRRRRQAA